jgi:Ca2+-binding EF-hand superfamily protein
MIGQLDTDGDGKISFVEFEKFMKEGDILLVLDE